MYARKSLYIFLCPNVSSSDVIVVKLEQKKAESALDRSATSKVLQNLTSTIVAKKANALGRTEEVSLSLALFSTQIYQCLIGVSLVKLSKTNSPVRKIRLCKGNCKPLSKTWLVRQEPKILLAILRLPEKVHHDFPKGVVPRLLSELCKNQRICETQ